ncbi:DUF5067 domain-containing protein [Lacticaseibacillus suibinensis]|uniref:DUF5067 domain-containing protein n=1 Tax=Lacticaseibacillus suibinensis TaxID=2486011 RepID=UPI000F76F2C4|nr:DUF5067 domain-containing protein [Lacticaseibacillus suibinensis]
MKKLIALGVTIVAALSLAACGSSSGQKDSSSKTEKASKVDSSKESSKKAASSSKKADTKTIPTTPDEDWFYSADQNVYYAGNETMTFTKSEVRDGYDNSKVLVVYVTIRNNSKEEMDPSNFMMVITGKQKTDTSNVVLDPGTLDSDENGNDPLQTLEDNFNNSLLPGKTVQAVMLYKLINNNPVQLTMTDSDGIKDIGTREYSVK